MPGPIVAMMAAVTFLVDMQSAHQLLAQTLSPRSLPLLLPSHSLAFLLLDPLPLFLCTLALVLPFLLLFLDFSRMHHLLHTPLHLAFHLLHFLARLGVALDPDEHGV